MTQQQGAPAVGSPEFAATVRARTDWRQEEVRVRVPQRDAIFMAFGFLVFSGILATGPGALLGPLLLLFPAAVWLQHDTRIGRIAQYVQLILEPTLQKLDGVEGFEDFLDRMEAGRSFGKKFHFTSICNRLFSSPRSRRSRWSTASSATPASTCTTGHRCG